MALYPSARWVLDRMAERGTRPFNEVPVERARQQFDAMMAGAPRPEVARTEDRTVPGPAGDIPVRIYWPQQQTLPLLLVYFHGGGWIMGSIESHDPTCRAIANVAGCIVVSVGYRLAPEHKFPEPLEDCYAAVRWAAENAASLGADPSLLAVGGDSAGGNLAAAVSLLARDRGGPRLVHQVLAYPVLSHGATFPSYEENADGYFLTRDMMLYCWRQYLRDEKDGDDPYASPLKAPDLSDLPTATIITAEHDPLRDEAESYGVRLAQAGVPNYCLRYVGMIHGFLSLDNLLPPGRHALWSVATGLRLAATETHKRA